MAKKVKKRKNQMPPLSFIDQLIYGIVAVILFMACFATFFFALYLRGKIAFADEMMIAKYDHASVLWALISVITVLLFTLIPWSTLYEKRQPIFGKRNFSYGPPAWPKVYPIFMKNKPPVWVSEKKKQDRKITAVILLIVFVIGMIPFPLSLYGRTCLYYDGSIQKYNMFNRCTESVLSGQIKSVEFGINKSYHIRRGRMRGSVYVVLTTDDGDTYTFDNSDFQSTFFGGEREWPDAMLQLKGRYSPEIISYSGLENLEFNISYYELTEEEAETLYKLFGVI